MLLAHALMRLPMTSAAPAGSTMIAGDTNGGSIIGFAAAVNPSGWAPSGSLSPDTISGAVVTILGDYFGAFLILVTEGNQASALAGKKLIIDAAEYEMDTAAQPPTYDGDSNSTSVLWSGTYGFVNSNSYTVDIV